MHTVKVLAHGKGDVSRSAASIEQLVHRDADKSLLCGWRMYTEMNMMLPDPENSRQVHHSNGFDRRMIAHS